MKKARAAGLGLLIAASEPVPSRLQKQGLVSYADGSDRKAFGNRRPWLSAVAVFISSGDAVYETSRATPSLRP